MSEEMKIFTGAPFVLRDPSHIHDSEFALLDPDGYRLVLFYKK
ncbi:hypothetical protein GCM10009838_51540 [Catenulispora subtropica]|uniref:Uncharacterized protein n=1 Tax=Catenulispora subtropica TaxID=450798 RepID=A0ABN2SBM1_9ACTN